MLQMIMDAEKQRLKNGEEGAKTIPKDYVPEWKRALVVFCKFRCLITCLCSILSKFGRFDEDRDK